MYLSEWLIGRDEALCHEIINDYSLHQRVFDLFPNSNSRNFLYCSKQASGCELKVQIQSFMPPLDPGYGEIRTKEIPKSFFSHQMYVFTVRFCPVVQSEKGVIPLKKEEEVVHWLLKRESFFGVCFHEDSLMKTGSGTLFMSQKGNPKKIRIDYVEMTGVFDVNDSDLFLTMIENGIGRSKGFGLGMFQLRPIK